ncbi:hypothetical protein ACF1BB_18865 [Streptomyces griseoluteus]|uniref:hypothetical protein n=1 Tax=Streptomyces griseoluteus TaxID=29306 RepID=UPI00370115B1
MSKVKLALRAIVAPLTTVGMIAGLSLIATEPASASTIKDGWVQLCPWGNYKVHLEYVSGGDGISRVLSPTLNPGSACWWGPIPTDGKPALIYVVGHYNTTNGTFDVIGPSREYETFYNGKDGVGIAAEGTTENHGLSSHYYTY